jgi:hypothetical protein
MPWDRRIDHNRFEYFTRRFYFDGRKQGFPLEHFYETRVAARVRIAEDPSLRSADDADLPGRMPRARRLSDVVWVARRQEKRRRPSLGLFDGMRCRPSIRLFQMSFKKCSGARTIETM